MGSSPTPHIMTGSPCHHLGIVPPWRQGLYFSLLAVELEQQATGATAFAVSLFGFQ